MRYWFLLLGIGLLGYALTGVVQVRPGERAVVRRFGRLLEHQPEPGLWVGLPLGMDRVDRVAVDRVQTVVVGYQEQDGEEGLPPGQMLTGDHNLVNVQAGIQYKVRPEDIVDYVLQGDRVDSLVARTAETVMAEWVTGRSVDDVLLNGKMKLRGPLVETVQERLEPYHVGVQVLDAQVSLIAPPNDVKWAFDRVAGAQTGISTLINKAEQDAASKERSARAYVYSVEQATAAQAGSKVLLARQEAEAFERRLREYQKARQHNPNYLRQIWEEERGKLLAQLKANKQIGLLDHHLGPDGLDLTVAPPVPPK
jgi:membrane protease subunit HflK